MPTQPSTTFRQESQPANPEKLYDERYRPQFHFSPRENWTNDPNGMMHYKSEYHLFFQHNPFGKNWGNMTWGHAVSPDMFHLDPVGSRDPSGQAGHDLLGLGSRGLGQHGRLSDGRGKGSRVHLHFGGETLHAVDRLQQ